MKISLNWIFDHIKGDVSSIDIAQLVDIFIRTTAEIEGWKKVGVNTDELTLAQIIAISEDTVTLHSFEHGKTYTLPMRADASMGLWFMIIDTGIAPRWATTVVFGGAKEMVVPA